MNDKMLMINSFRICVADIVFRLSAMESNAGVVGSLFKLDDLRNAVKANDDVEAAAGVIKIMKLACCIRLPSPLIWPAVQYVSCSYTWVVDQSL